MRIRILGSAARGGFPQWNCNCSGCYGVRNGSVKARYRTQCSIAISLDNENWLLCNASPDIRVQLEGLPDIHPARGLRDTGVRAVILTDAGIEHCGGLLTLQDCGSVALYGSEQTEKLLRENYAALMGGGQSAAFSIQHIEADSGAFQIKGVEGLRVTAIEIGAALGLYIEDPQNGCSLFYAPCCIELNSAAVALMQRSDLVLIDGTFWSEEEMILTGVGTSLARELGHQPLSGSGGTLEQLGSLTKPKKILLHINNTNPILIEDSPEYLSLAEQGVEVAYDDMELYLGSSNGRSDKRGRA